MITEHLNLTQSLSLSFSNTINITNLLPYLPLHDHFKHHSIYNLSIHIVHFMLLTKSLFFLFSSSYSYSYMGDNNVNLPPGFRFSPSDEELLVHFLQRKASLLPYHPDIIPDLDLYPYDPWDLDGKALGEGNKWYFYSRRMQNRVTNNGYWNSLGGDEPIFSSTTSKKVGTKKYYAFYIGESSRGVKTNWILQEYKLSDVGSSSRSSSKRKQSKTDHTKLVVCRVYENSYDEDDNDSTELSCLDEVFLSLDELDDDFDEISLPN